MNLTTLLANFALIKIIYIIFFLVLVIVINLSLSKKQNKKEEESPNSDIYISDKEVCCDAVDEVSSKN